MLQAKINLHNLGMNPYPGRGIVCGLDETGEFLVQVYWIMGRSENSRNRVFVLGEDGLLSTAAADPSKVKDPSLIIYNAMRENPGCVVSNGNQTDSIGGRLSYGYVGLYDAVRSFDYEPDAPNFTPRITAISEWWSRSEDEHLFFPKIEMSILRKSLWSDACDRNLYEFNDIGKGYGYCFHTYSGDGDPLPAFQGEPYLVPLKGHAGQITDKFWQTLDADNRVALAVKFIAKDGQSHTVIRNKYSKV
jgi:hypothetical protein